MNIVIFGSGSMGTRYRRLISDYFPEHHWFNYVRIPDEPIGAQIRKRILRWIAPKDVAFICNPTNHHIETAIACAEAGMHLFIEKPLDCDLSRLGQLKQTVAANHLTAYVAYPFRHDLTLNRTKEITDDATSAEAVCYTDARKWMKPYSRSMSTGGGALPELSHEIDYMQYLFGEIVDITGNVGTDNLITDAEEWADLTLIHEGSRVTKVHLDLTSEKELRYLRIGRRRWNLSVTDEMYIRQLRYFFNNIGNPEIMNGLDEAGALIEKILAFREKAWTRLLP